MTLSERGETPLAIARGAVREGLAALEGFSDLLGSRRIGPRALAQARSEMVPACEALRATCRRSSGCNSCWTGRSSRSAGSSCDGLLASASA